MIRDKVVCDIIIPVWNNLDLTRNCAESVFKNTHFAFRLIIVDNGSDMPTADYLRSLANKKKKKCSWSGTMLIRDLSRLPMRV